MTMAKVLEGGNIRLHEDTRVVRDLRIAPVGTKDLGRLALVTSMGKKLSLVSLDGMLLIFDSRNTLSPVNTIRGYGNQPIHTLHSVACYGRESSDYGGKLVLSASVLGLQFGILGDVAVASYRPKTALQVAGSSCSSPYKEVIVCSQSISPKSCMDISSSFTRTPRMSLHYVLTKEARGQRVVDWPLTS
eukprot:Gb_31576 [translate_table: standard]